MVNYIKNMVNNFPEDVQEPKCPWNDKLFKVEENANEFQDNKRDLFHTFVAKGLFASKSARPDIQPAIAFLCTRVKEPTDNKWFKLQ
jgi:hypothetical protein